MQQMNMLILKIQDRKYGMRKMPPIKGSAFGIRVSSVLSKILSSPNAKTALLDIQSRFHGLSKAEDTNNAAVSTKDALTFGQTILMLLSDIDPNAVIDIIREAFSYEVYCDNKKLSDDVVFDEHFEQYPGDLYVVGIWAAYNHVKDFFTGLGDGIKAFMPSSGNNQSSLQ